MRSSTVLPKIVVLELTYRCNQSCKFCSCPWENTENASLYYEKKPELSIEEWKKALSVLDGAGVKTVSISGGEALLKNGLDELLRHIRAKTGLNQDKRIVVISNGALMSEHFLALFKETNVRLSLSLPGLSTFQYHTGASENSTANVLHWLGRANEESVSSTVNITVTKRNFHELYETIANGLIAGADRVLLNRFLVGGRGIAYKKELSLSRGQLAEALDIAEDVLSVSKRGGSVGTEYPICIIKDGGKQYERLRVGSLCAAGREFFVVDPSGYIRTCNHSPRRVGHIFGSDIVSDKDYWRVFAERAYELPAMCDGCGFRGGCDCGCREAAAICGGSLSAPDPCFSE